LLQSANLAPQLRFYTIWIIRLVVAGIFMTAALTKLSNPQQFAETIANYQLFPYTTWNLLAIIVPMLELIANIALLCNWQRRGAVVLLFGLTLSFMLLIVSAIVRNLNIECGCFGQSEPGNPLGWPLFWRDLGLCSLILFAGLNPKANVGEPTLPQKI